MNKADEQAAEEYYSLLETYIRELNKAHKGIRRLVRRNRKLEAQVAYLNEGLKACCEELDQLEELLK